MQRNTTIGNVIDFDKGFGGQRWVDSIPKVIYDLEFMLGDDHEYIINAKSKFYDITGLKIKK